MVRISCLLSNSLELTSGTSKFVFTVLLKNISLIKNFKQKVNIKVCNKV